VDISDIHIHSLGKTMTNLLASFEAYRSERGSGLSRTSIIQDCQGTDEEASLGDRVHSGLNMETKLRVVPCR